MFLRVKKLHYVGDAVNNVASALWLLKFFS